MWSDRDYSTGVNMMKLTEEEKKKLQEEKVTQEESDEIDRIINNMQGMLVILS